MPTTLTTFFSTGPSATEKPGTAFNLSVETVDAATGLPLNHDGQVQLALVSEGGTGAVSAGPTVFPSPADGVDRGTFPFTGVTLAGSGQFRLRATPVGGTHGFTLAPSLSDYFLLHDADTIDASAEHAEPGEAYDFLFGSTHYRYASGAQPIVVSGQTYLPAAVKRSTREQTTDFGRATLKFTLDRLDPLATALLGLMSGLDTSLTLTMYAGDYRFSGDTVEWGVAWKGRMAGLSAQGELVTAEFEPVFAGLQRLGLRARYETTCRHVLYGEGCGLDAAANRVAADVGLTFTGRYLEAVFAADPFAGTVRRMLNGMVERQSTGVRRFIVAATYASPTHHVYTLDRPMPTPITTGDDLWVYYGCRRTVFDCKAFNNIRNFGGFPLIPAFNPFSTDLGGL